MSELVLHWIQPTTWWKKNIRTSNHGFENIQRTFFFRNGFFNGCSSHWRSGPENTVDVEPINTINSISVTQHVVLMKNLQYNHSLFLKKKFEIWKTLVYDNFLINRVLTWSCKYFRHNFNIGYYNHVVVGAVHRF